MKFSIITAVYNQKHYLLKLIESLKRQTYKSFEWHVCDDGSTDGTDKFFRRFYFPGVYYHRLRKNTGNLSKNLNQGIKKAKGDYCVFIMGDSFPELNYLEILNEWVNPDFLICGIRINIEGDRVVDLDYRLRKKVIPKDPVLLPKEPWNIATGNGLTIPTQALRKYGGWNEKFCAAKGKQAGEDQEIIARLYFKGYLVWSVPSLILYHHWHKNILNENIKFVDKLIRQYAS